MQTPKNIYSYTQLHVTELGQRILSSYPPLHNAGEAPSPLLASIRRALPPFGYVSFDSSCIVDDPSVRSPSLLWRRFDQYSFDCRSRATATSHAKSAASTFTAKMFLTYRDWPCRGEVTEQS